MISGAPETEALETISERGSSRGRTEVEAPHEEDASLIVGLPRLGGSQARGAECPLALRPVFHPGVFHPGLVLHGLLTDLLGRCAPNLARSLAVPVACETGRASCRARWGQRV